MAACEHGGGIFLEAGGLCWECYLKASGAVTCPASGETALPDRFGCPQWRPAEAEPPLHWCFWCQDYRAARWPG